MTVDEVWWEDDPSHRITVLRGCKVCRADPVDPTVVSPAGLVHESTGWNDGKTDCGKDATKPNWWWRG